MNQIDCKGTWAEKMNGFKWNKNKDGFKVNIDPRFLSRAFCLSYSYDIIQQAGKWEKWYRGRTVAGLTRIEIAADGIRMNPSGG